MTGPEAGGEDLFWERAGTLMSRAGVSRSTMMGLPCLRVDGRFFASYDRRTGDLLVKLPAAVVDELVQNGRARSFAPAGRRFREWAAVPAADSNAWSAMLDEAFIHVAAGTG